MLFHLTAADFCRVTSNGDESTVRVDCTNQERNSYTNMQIFQWIRWFADNRHNRHDVPLWVMLVLVCFERIAAMGVYKTIPARRQVPVFLLLLICKASTMRNLLGLCLSGHRSVLEGRPTDIPLCLLFRSLVYPEEEGDEDEERRSIYKEIDRLPHNVDGDIVSQQAMDFHAD